MIERVTIEELVSRNGFEAMIKEYGGLADPLWGKPTYCKEEYLPIEKAGLLAVYCAMERDMVVGVAACLKGRIPHHSANVGIVESLYLMAEYRAKGHGIRLIEACEDFARIENLPYLCVQVHEDELIRLGVVLDRRNYSVKVHTYARKI